MKSIVLRNWSAKVPTNQISVVAYEIWAVAWQYKFEFGNSMRARVFCVYKSWLEWNFIAKLNRISLKTHWNFTGTSSKIKIPEKNSETIQQKFKEHSK